MHRARAGQTFPLKHPLQRHHPTPLSNVDRPTNMSSCTLHYKKMMSPSLGGGGMFQDQPRSVQPSDTGHTGGLCALTQTRPAKSHALQPCNILPGPSDGLSLQRGSWVFNLGAGVIRAPQNWGAGVWEKGSIDRTINELL